MSTEKSKVGITPEQQEDKKKKELFQRLSWSGVLEPVEEKLGARILNSKIEGVSGRMDMFFPVKRNDDSQWEIQLGIFLGKDIVPKILVKFTEDGMVTLFSFNKQIKPSELYTAYAPNQLYVDHKLNSSISTKLKELLDNPSFIDSRG